MSVQLDPTWTLDEAFRRVAAESYRRPALCGVDTAVITFGELDRRIEHVAASLISHGIRCQDRVALAMVNSSSFVESFFGIVRAGAIAVPLNPELTQREFAAIGENLEIHLTLADELTLDRARAIGSSCTARLVDILDVASSVVPPGSLTHADSTAAIFMTSGTTGTPKVIAHSHRAMVGSAVRLQELHRAFFTGSLTERARRVITVMMRYRQRLLHATGRQVWYTPMSFSTIAGYTVLQGALLGGHAVVVSPVTHPREVLSNLERYQVNIAAMSPTMLEALLRVKGLQDRDLSSLVVVGLGGAPARPRLLREAQRLLGCGITVGYGSTELVGGATVTRLEDPEDKQHRTVGRPFPGTELRIVDAFGGDLPNGIVGEVWVRQTSGADVEDQWTASGDLGSVDEQGFVTIAGRQREVVLRGGYTIVPAEVEAVLETHVEVVRAAVVGVPQVQANEQMWAFVSCDGVVPGGGQRLRSELFALCRDHLARFKIPDHIRVKESLPLTQDGKVRKFLLIEEANAYRTVRTRDDEGDETPTPESAGS